MLKWSGWKKPVLISIVCVLHLVFITGFNFSLVSGKPSKIIGKNAENLFITLRSPTSQPLADTLLNAQATIGQAESKVTNLVKPAATQKSALTETPHWSGFRSSDYFLDTDLVDTTAEPSVDFEELLARMLPLNIKAVVLEFWIEKDGRTVEVRCLEGECNEDVIASLPGLTDLAFKPAIKNGEAVANRKVIQIDAKLSLGI